ncbi:MAG: hypothetical protein MUE81_16620 [Thermoflexibacter sp.]|jgi:hypothetical protein|nr:hypothetical protein [Thermoflexibacter sp.]
MSNHHYCLKVATFLIFLSLFTFTYNIFAQNLPNSTSTPKQTGQNNFYFGLYLGSGANSWQITPSQFNLMFPVTPSDFINATTSVTDFSYAPNLNFGLEIGGSRSWYGAFDMQFTFGGMTGSYFGISTGLNVPLSNNGRATLQLGSGLFYQISKKNLDRRRLQQSVNLDGRFFNNNNTFISDLIDENFGLRPCATLRLPIGAAAHLKLTGGYQFNFISISRIRFSQTRPSRNRRNTSSTTTARFRTDDGIFDFQYNNQRIIRTPFDYSGFFVNIGIAWIL